MATIAVRRSGSGIWRMRGTKPTCLTMPLLTAPISAAPDTNVSTDSQAGRIVVPMTSTNMAPPRAG